MRSKKLSGLIAAMAAFLLTGGTCEQIDKQFSLGFPAYNPATVLRPSDEVTTPSARPFGKVFIIGGITAINEEAVLEVFNPTSQKFGNAGFQGGSSGFAAVELTSGTHSGQVLIAAGAVGTATLSANGLMTFAASVPRSAELYKSSSGAVTGTGSLNNGRCLNTATLLPNGKVLFAGGFDKNGNPLASAEIYTPSTGQFSLTAAMSMRRAMHTATLLDDGTVLLAGGINDAQGDTYGTAEIYDPAAGTFTPTLGQMPQGDGVAGHTATLLLNGHVLIARGLQHLRRRWANSHLQHDEHGIAL